MSELSLELALGAFEALKTPGKITAALRGGDRESLRAAADGLEERARVDLAEKAAAMQSKGIDVSIFGDDDFPEALVHQGKPLMPVLFYRGNKKLFYQDGVGMCGSRNVSEKGLRAAQRCGFAVSERDLTVVSGYAKGVDTATHLAALRAGGSTVIVLAEGFDHFRIKRDFAADFDPERTLVVSQFPPSQPWAAHAAMARNSIIFGLARALVVIEAGEKGGTLAAGEGAMRLGRPVFVLDFGDETPGGNRKLLADGAHPVRTTSALHDMLDKVSNHEMPATEGAALF